MLDRSERRWKGMMKRNMDELDEKPAPKRRPARRIIRALLAIIGLVGVIAVPVAAWQTLAPSDAETRNHESAGGSVSPEDPSLRRSLGPLGTRAQDTASELKTSLPDVKDTLLRAYLRFQGEDALAPVSDDPTPVTFTISPGETAAQIAQRLAAEGLIRDANLFQVLLRVRGVDTQLEAGDYQLRRNMNMEEVMATLQVGRPPTIALTIPEGWRAEQIAGLLKAKDVADPGRFLELVHAGTGFSYDFLANRPEDVKSLEGYLFPDTYEFHSDATAADVIDRMLTTFDERFTSEMRQQAEAQGLSIHEVVTVASIVEREARVPEERAVIASVFHNRLAVGMHLNADPTVQYALGYQEDTEQWWKRPLYFEDLEYDSPYNTYKYIGLPPGPICNPGLAALQATVDPAETNYYYFVANDVAGDGSHVFAETLEEHRANIEKYRR